MIEELETKEPLEILPDKSFLLDTCFLLYELEKDNEKKLEEFCQEHNVYMTSFNIEELEHVEKRIPNIKHKVKSFLQKKLIKKILIDVHLGETIKEKKYSDETNHNLLKKIHDPSDALLVAAAIRTKSDILTRDKHHIFTSEVENELKKFGIDVKNKF